MESEQILTDEDFKRMKRLMRKREENEEWGGVDKKESLGNVEEIDEHSIDQEDSEDLDEESLGEGESAQGDIEIDS